LAAERDSFWSERMIFPSSQSPLRLRRIFDLKGRGGGQFPPPWRGRVRERGRNSRGGMKSTPPLNPLSA
jgi:hypothetical protein